MVRGTAGCFRHHPRKSQCRQIQLVNEGTDNSDRTVFAHVVVKTVRKQCYLTTVTTFDKPGHRNLQDFVPDFIKQLAFSHNLHPDSAGPAGRREGPVRSNSSRLSRPPPSAQNAASGRSPGDHRTAQVDLQQPLVVADVFGRGCRLNGRCSERMRMLRVDISGHRGRTISARPRPRCSIGLDPPPRSRDLQPRIEIMELSA